MAERKATRLSKAAREFNVGISTIVEFLGKKGHEIDSNPNSKLEPDLYELLQDNRVIGIAFTIWRGSGFSTRSHLKNRKMVRGQGHTK